MSLLEKRRQPGYPADHRNPGGGTRRDAHGAAATASPLTRSKTSSSRHTKRSRPTTASACPSPLRPQKSLLKRGIDSVADLPRLVPGLTLQDGAFNSTSITLRGVGFFNSDLDTPPAVTVYVDEAPLTYPVLTKLAAFDLARVEVLKGPQGTLFGQNATGGAVNYIAARPTDKFAPAWIRATELSTGCKSADSSAVR